MATSEFPEFYGCAVERTRGKNEFVLTLPFAAAPRGRIQIVAFGAPDDDPKINYDRGKLAVLELAAEYAVADDAQIWADRAEAHRARTHAAMRARAEAAGAAGEG